MSYIPAEIVMEPPDVTEYWRWAVCQPDASGRHHNRTIAEAEAITALKRIHYKQARGLI
jgi:hypothetical protein